jgi:hypothetical protein
MGRDRENLSLDVRVGLEARELLASISLGRGLVADWRAVRCSLSSFRMAIILL